MYLESLLFHLLNIHFLRSIHKREDFSAGCNFWQAFHTYSQGLVPSLFSSMLCTELALGDHQNIDDDSECCSVAPKQGSHTTISQTCSQWAHVLGRNVFDLCLPCFGTVTPWSLPNLLLTRPLRWGACLPAMKAQTLDLLPTTPRLLQPSSQQGPQALLSTRAGSLQTKQVTCSEVFSCLFKGLWRAQ